MQKSFNHLTPQKKGLSIHSFHEDSLLKELSPQVMTVSSSNYGKIKLELMSSPLPTSKDLFAQLLASEQKIVDEEDFQRYQILEEDSNENMDDVIVSDEHSESGSFDHDQYDYDEENGTRKRKRKSTGQLRILKNQLNNEPNWDKDKITEMAEATGLHPSQVYKWWWDQKKKNMKYEKEALMKAAAKKKMIRKDYIKRPFGESNSNIEQQSYERAETKPKLVSGLSWESQNVGRTINKRLSFA